MDKIDRYDKNEKLIIYRCYSNYFLSKLIVENEPEILSRKDNPEFTCYNRSSGPKFSYTSHKFWDQSPPPLINDFWKYLRQLIGTSFSVATLPIYYDIE